MGNVAIEDVTLIYLKSCCIEINVKEQQAFLPAKGLANRHLQTLMPVLLGRFNRMTYIRQELSLPDGDFVDLDWTSIPDNDTTTPIVIIFHGLGGSSRSHYTSALMRAAQHKGWHAVVMNFRGCSGRQNRKARLYHSGETADAGYFIEWLKHRYPLAPRYAVGFSLGGNMLLKLAGEQGNALAVDALVSVSAPIKLDASTRYMIRGLSRLYQSYLLRELKHKVLDKYSQHDYKSLLGLDKHDIVACKDIREFDDLFTSRLHGFEGAQDYYSRCSADAFIEQIARPCLLIHANDDPLAPASILPEQMALPDTVQLEVTANGGHAGYLGGTILRPRFWVAGRALAYFSQFERSE